MRRTPRTQFLYWEMLYKLFFNAFISHLNSALLKSIHSNQGWNGSLIYRVGYKICRNFRTGRSVTCVTLRYRPTIVLCCINRAQILSRKIRSRSIKLGHLAVLARSSELAVFIHAKTVKCIEIQQARAGYSNCVGVYWLSVYQFDLPIVVTNQKIVLYLQQHNKLHNIIKSKELKTEQSISP